VNREFPDAPVVGVGAVVLDAGRVLLVRRGRPPLKGEWSIPGGALELGETLADGVRRELLEETGLIVEVVALIDVLDRIVPERADKRRIQYHYVLVDFLCKPVGGELRAGSDAAEACWVAQADLASYGLAEITMRVIDRAFAMLP
jgi:ADP-ribose pyrophosphatase YjhB (NUDIX family)